jgi:hypothetical protein
VPRKALPLLSSPQAPMQRATALRDATSFPSFTRCYVVPVVRFDGGLGVVLDVVLDVVFVSFHW